MKIQEMSINKCKIKNNIYMYERKGNKSSPHPQKKQEGRNSDGIANEIIATNRPQTKKNE